jgi:hypothetical protein
MFHNPPKVLPPFIRLHLIIMYSLNFILLSFSSRIRSRGEFFFNEGGLYPLPCNTSSTTHVKQVFSSSKIPQSRWHSRLGHPSSSIVRFVLSQNSLPFGSDVSLDHVCDACQQAKSHLLPYPKSFSTSKAPLELIFSDVWGPAYVSTGRNKYYVSFIDDFSKFT